MVLSLTSRKRGVQMGFVESSFPVIIASIWLLLATVFLFTEASGIQIGVAIICANIWMAATW